MFKHTTYVILPYIHALFNQIFATGLFPLDWSESVISPIQKKGPKCDSNNYRAVSLINSLCKICMRILSNRVTNWCEHHNITDESQAGFRKQYSTIDNIFNLQAAIQKYRSIRKGRFYVFYIDFKSKISMDTIILKCGLVCKDMVYMTPFLEFSNLCALS